MGKFNKSLLNDKYSDWHYRDERFARNAFLTDVDRIWAELRSGQPSLIAVTDIKEPKAEITWTKNATYNWFESKGLPVYVIGTTTKFESFEVKRWRSGIKRIFNQQQYIDWVNNLQNRLF